MAVTLKEVAELAGVSRSAVSRTFTEGASVSAATRAKVEKAAATLGYHPSMLASSLSTGRTKMVGLISDNFKNPIFLQVFDLFTRGLQDRGLRPLLVNLTGQSDPEPSIKMLRQYSVDGVVLASSTLPASLATAFRAAGVPVVHAFGRHSDRPRVDTIGIDNQACGRMAARTLIARGYDRIAFMGGPESATSTRDRFAGFMDVATDTPGIEVTHSFARAYSFNAGREEMSRLIGLGPAQAYFCGDDVLSIGALSAIQSAEMRCPDDIGLIGLNDMEMAGWANIGLTTIHQPVTDITQAALDRMIDILEGRAPKPEARLFDCHIIERDTLHPLPA